MSKTVYKNNRKKVKRTVKKKFQEEQVSFRSNKLTNLSRHTYIKEKKLKQIEKDKPVNLPHFYRFKIC